MGKIDFNTSKLEPMNVIVGFTVGRDNLTNEEANVFIVVEDSDNKFSTLKEYAPYHYNQIKAEDSLKIWSRKWHWDNKSYFQLKECLSTMIENGLIEKFSKKINDGSSNNNGKLVYKITEKGRRFLHISQEIESLTGIKWEHKDTTIRPVTYTSCQSV